MNKLILLAGFCLFSTATTAATISLPDGLFVQAINGETIQNETQLYIPNGHHLIELKYIEDLSENADESAFYQSETLYWNLTIHKDELMTVTIPSIDSIEEANRFVKDAQIMVNSASLGSIPSKLITHTKLMSDIMSKRPKLMGHN